VIITRTTAGAGLPSGFPFSLGSESNGNLYISGMPALNAEGKFQPGTFMEETDLAWRNIENIAAAAGFEKSEIIYVQCVLSDIDDYASLNDWWRHQFPDIEIAPARFTFQAGALPFGAKIEIQAVAGRGDR
jgi:2-iminobutanoate/2-iminopropanoate deaminase